MQDSPPRPPHSVLSVLVRAAKLSVSVIYQICESSQTYPGQSPQDIRVG